ncbi:bifunctional precorrin-2 dehydrogenase/sirohydrochlorin ferrochelatase [Bifidobacterium callimiconis]|uniref:precorrin-2 dehydrogenase/sirohydrochlorin ferrochelatase family protein n=1 Tax=Bifidobacterium callimiconis TaxID=2306973 RepID=UPI001BDD9AB8|nr:bifunctional precorrin-2 dehydrogenase/sirohydrochlorin ferrochelatase [Bifidobacterium callimiconis]MBT1177753.1 bifunctional precorrin-2 dehydrogenase/sirohydrochlorin ferrochelatase [Bifidobacterium callimiconis]
MTVGATGDDGEDVSGKAAARPYPVNLDIRGRLAVVVGGGRVAARKVASLLRSGAHVIVISPTLDPRIAGEAKRGRVTWVDKPYKSGDNSHRGDEGGVAGDDVGDDTGLAGAFIVIACTDDPEANARAVRDAKAAGVPLVNNAADPAQSNFGNVAVTEQDGLMITVSTYGRDPSRARRMKERIARWLSSGSR